MHLNSIDKWRQVAVQFQAIRTELALGNLSESFEPFDLAALRQAPRTAAIRAIFTFLLHIWNDSTPFDLSQVRRWDRDHRRAFSAWVDGSVTGEPCHYF